MFKLCWLWEFDKKWCMCKDLERVVAYSRILYRHLAWKDRGWPWQTSVLTGKFGRDANQVPREKRLDRCRFTDLLGPSSFFGLHVHALATLSRAQKPITCHSFVGVFPICYMAHKTYYWCSLWFVAVHMLYGRKVCNLQPDLLRTLQPILIPFRHSPLWSSLRSNMAVRKKQRSLSNNSH